MKYLIKGVFFVVLTSYLATAGNIAGWRSFTGHDCSSYNTWQGAELIYSYLRYNHHTASMANAFEDAHAKCEANKHVCGQHKIHFTVKHYRHVDEIYFNVKGKTTICAFARKGFTYTHFNHDALKCAMASKNVCLYNAMTTIFFHTW